MGQWKHARNKTNQTKSIPGEVAEVLQCPQPCAGTLHHVTRCVAVFARPSLNIGFVRDIILFKVSAGTDL
eukprot:1719030-Karenia_brevis.AAC.1